MYGTPPILMGLIPPASAARDQPMGGEKMKEWFLESRSPSHKVFGGTTTSSPNICVQRSSRSSALPSAIFQRLAIEQPNCILFWRSKESVFETVAICWFPAVLKNKASYTR